MERMSLTDALIQAEAYASRARVLPGSKHAGLRRLEAWLSWPLLRRQLKYNTAVYEALRQLKTGLDATSAGGSGATRSAFASHHEGIAALRRDMVVLQQEMTELVRRVDTVASGARTGAAHVDLFLNEVRRALPEPPRPERLAALPDAWQGLWSAFEEVCRGSFEEIAGRQKPYLDDLPAAEGRPVCDLGAGRGEWLSLLADSGVAAYGVESNPEAAAAGRARGLDVRTEDALEHLAAVPERSLRAVTAFHLAEHLDVTGLLAVLDGALRALAPGGRLILETPNPDNLAVGASSFHLDPTHRTPLPPALLEFLVGARGFTEVEVRPLRRNPPVLAAETDDPVVADIVSLLQQHLGAAEDYAVLATRL